MHTSISRLFTEHPQSINETYLQHLGAAAGMSVRLAGAALACLVHGILPFLFKRTASRLIFALHHKMDCRLANGECAEPWQTQKSEAS